MKLIKLLHLIIVLDQIICPRRFIISYLQKIISDKRIIVSTQKSINSEIPMIKKTNLKLITVSISIPWIKCVDQRKSCKVAKIGENVAKLWNPCKSVKLRNPYKKLVILILIWARRIFGDSDLRFWDFEIVIRAGLRHRPRVQRPRAHVSRGPKKMILGEGCM